MECRAESVQTQMQLPLKGSPLSPVAFSKPDSEDPVERAKRLLREADAVFFDVDSSSAPAEGFGNLLGKFRYFEASGWATGVSASSDAMRRVAIQALWSRPKALT